ncbi:MAG: ribonuclease PH [Synergistales bacterium]|nr:ribonuclease PH [Synergistales bacterium]
MVYQRLDGREHDEIRPMNIQRDFTMYAEGSVFIASGNTQVICTASIEDKVPPFLKGTGQGWVTAEYAMLPRSTQIRIPRTTSKGTVNGRASEIQRLIGRSLRASIDLTAIGERTIWIDCDVIQADGGTRTASISGAFVALVDALRKLWSWGGISCIPIRSFIGAVSVGKVEGELMVDLTYLEDSSAEVDLNVVMDAQGNFVEVQGTGETGTFSRMELDRMLSISEKAIREIFNTQRRSLALSDEEKAVIGV